MYQNDTLQFERPEPVGDGETLEDNIQSLSDDGEFSTADFRRTEKVPASDGKFYETSIYNLEVLNQLAMAKKPLDFWFEYNYKAKKKRRIGLHIQSASFGHPEWFWNDTSSTAFEQRK